MKQQDAILHLTCLMHALQRYRSVGAEMGLESVGPDLWPWVFGDRCPLPALQKVLDRADTTGLLVPMDYYNLMIAFTHFCPEVIVVANTSVMPEGAAPIALEPPAAAEILHGWLEP